MRTASSGASGPPPTKLKSSALIAALHTARRCTEDELIVFLVPDSGSRYLNKIYNDVWMRENRYLEPEVKVTVGEVVRSKQTTSRITGLLTIQPQDTVMDALSCMQKNDVSQLPVFEEGKPIGALHEDDVLGLVLKGKHLKELVVREVMGRSLPVVEPATLVGEVTGILATQGPAVFVRIAPGKFELITKYDILHALGKGE